MPAVPSWDYCHPGSNNDQLHTKVNSKRSDKLISLSNTFQSGIFDSSPIEKVMLKPEAPHLDCQIYNRCLPCVLLDSWLNVPKLAEMTFMKLMMHMMMAFIVAPGLGCLSPTVSALEP